MKEIIWLLPILAVIAVVLGGCRGETANRILRESTRSFVKLVVGMILLGVGIQLLLMLVPLFY